LLLAVVIVSIAAGIVERSKAKSRLAILVACRIL
jgi:hypothetical protein